jgi:UDP:flavonoid glycosyltransferase YjiC (YdhE family)
MRIAIQTLGTRGDVQPYLALALALRAAGHHVQMAAPGQFEALVGQRGIDFAALPREFLDLLETPEGKAAMAGRGGFNAGFRLLKHFRPIGRRLLSAQWQAARSFAPDLIVHHPKAIAAPHIAERLGCPAVLASPLPGFTPTADFASPLLPFRSAGPFNRMSHSLMAGSGDFLFRSAIAEWRVTELDLPRRASKRAEPRLTLYAYSPGVVPRPADWGPGVVVTGYWFLDDDTGWAPPPDLAEFLAGGEPPVYVGFGSVPGIAPAELTGIVAESLARLGRRGLLATGGGALAVGEGRHLHFIDHAPHDRLFPLVAACVHHGGAGTTAASLRAGKPTVICPFFGDQPFWARRVAELGAGPAPLKRSSLSSDSLAAAIAATRDPSIIATARELGVRIRTENGVAVAVAAIEREFRHGSAS